MQHRDGVVIKKIISEMRVGIKLLGTTELDDFLNDEYPILISQLESITNNN